MLPLPPPAPRGLLLFMPFLLLLENVLSLPLPVGEKRGVKGRGKKGEKERLFVYLFVCFIDFFFMYSSSQDGVDPEISQPVLKRYSSSFLFKIEGHLLFLKIFIFFHLFSSSFTFHSPSLSFFSFLFLGIDPVLRETRLVNYYHVKYYFRNNETTIHRTHVCICIFMCGVGVGLYLSTNYFL